MFHRLAVITRHLSSAASPRVVRVPKFVEDPDLYVQLTPGLPDGIHGASVVVQEGRYASTWVRVRSADLTAAELSGLIDEAVGRRRGAVYVGIPHRIAAETALLATVLNHGLFRFYNFNMPTNELVYYSWCHPALPDLVPPYSSSIEGGGVLVLSPDETHVLLALEYGRYGRCGGSVHAGESCLAAALREVREETAVLLDSRYSPRLALTYNQPRSRDGTINDHFLLFVARAKSTALRIDKNELADARWFEISALVGAWQSVKQTLLGEAGALPRRTTLLGESVGVMELLALEKIVEGKTLPVQYVDTGRGLGALSHMF